MKVFQSGPSNIYKGLIFLRLYINDPTYIYIFIQRENKIQNNPDRDENTVGRMLLPQLFDFRDQSTF